MIRRGIFLAVLGGCLLGMMIFPGLVFADLKSDGKADAIFGNLGISSEASLGDGCGNFTCSDIGVPSTDIALGLGSGTNT